VELIMEKWCQSTTAKPAIFHLDKQLASKMLEFFKKEIYWDTTQDNQDLNKNISKNIFVFSIIAEMEYHYIAFMLNYLREKKIDLAELILSDYLKKEFQGDPAKILFHANEMLHISVKEAAFFIEDAIGQKDLAQKLLVSDYYTLAQTVFPDEKIENRYKANLRKAQQVFHQEWSEMVKIKNELSNVANHPYPIKISINTVRLLNTYLVKDCLPNNQDLIIALVQQGVLRPDHLVHFDNHSKPLFEYYLARPTSSRRIVMIEMMNTYPEIFNWKKLWYILQKENVSYLKDFPEQEQNYNELVKIIKNNTLYYQLKDSLLPGNRQEESDNEKDEIQKI
jgi:hypothetical protein